MTEINKDLFDYMMHTQIANGRLANQQVSDIVGLLNEADKEIIAKIIARGEDGTFTTARLNALLKDIRETVDSAYWDAEKQLHDEMGGFAAHSAASTVDMLATQVPVSFKIVGMTNEQLLSIIDKTPIAIGKDKRLLLEEVFQSLAADKEEAIRGAIRLGMVEGESVASMVTRLRGTRSAQYRDGILETSRRDAASIVRTVVQSVNNSAVQATYAKNADIMTGWTYVATMDGRTCSYCWQNSGVTFPLGSGPTPPLHINCRCFAAPALKSWKDMGFDLAEMPAGQRAAKGGPVDANISFDAWMKTQDKATQVELLGVARQKYFAAGELPLSKFTDASGQLYTLDVLKERQSAAFARAFGN